MSLLDSLLMCPAEYLREQSGWDGSIEESRERLLAELSSELLSLVGLRFAVDSC